MNAAGQVLIEYLLLMAVFVLLLAVLFTKSLSPSNNPAPFLAANSNSALKQATDFQAACGTSQDPNGKGGAQQ